jgi:hypothetical protein
MRELFPNQPGTVLSFLYPGFKAFVSNRRGDFRHILFSPDSNAFRPAFLTIQLFLCNGISDSRLILCTKRVDIMLAEQFQKAIHVQKAISSLLTDQFLVSTPLPFTRMRDNAGTNHIQIDILDAIPQMLTVFNHGAMISVLPKGAAPVFALVVKACEVSLELLHHATDSSSSGLDGNFMSVVRSQAIVKKRHSKLLGCLPEALAILGAIAGETEQERTVVTAVS